MHKVAIVTDTNSSIEREEAKELGIELLTMPVIINGTEYIEGKNLTYEQFFEMLDQGADVSSSQPSPDEVTSLWDRVLAEYDELVHIPMSSSLSSSCQTAKALASEYEGRVCVVDNRRISITQRRSVLDALEMASRGYRAAEIAVELEKRSGENSIYLAVNTLELLKKSGRVTPAGAAFASVFSIKPVLTIQGGKLDAHMKCRGMNAAENAMLKVITQELHNRFYGKKVVVELAYSGDRKAAEAWEEKAQKYFENAEIRLFRLPLSICCHVAGGVRAIGISEVFE